MTNKEFKGFVRLSSDQYAELKLNGSLVIEGRTIEYSPLDTIYMITDAGNMIDVANTTEGEPNDVVLNITNNVLRAQLNQTIKTKIDNKQDKLTAGTNITIDTNNVISASGGLTKVVATDVDSESATNGQVLTANGSGGASWQNASGGKLYRHIVTLRNTDTNATNICAEFLTKSSTIMTQSDILAILKNDYLTTIAHYPCFPKLKRQIGTQTAVYLYVGLDVANSSSSTIRAYSQKIDTSTFTIDEAITFDVIDKSYILDTVTEL